MRTDRITTRIVPALLGLALMLPVGVPGQAAAETRVTETRTSVARKAPGFMRRIFKAKVGCEGVDFGATERLQLHCECSKNYQLQAEEGELFGATGVDYYKFSTKPELGWAGDPDRLSETEYMETACEKVYAAQGAQWTDFDVCEKATLSCCRSKEFYSKPEPAPVPK